jgi:hypothetical protein
MKSKRELLARKSNEELLDLWKRRADYPTETVATLQSLLSERNLEPPEPISQIGHHASTAPLATSLNPAGVPTGPIATNPGIAAEAADTRTPDRSKYTCTACGVGVSKEDKLCPGCGLQLKFPDEFRTLKKIGIVSVAWGIGAVAIGAGIDFVGKGGKGEALAYLAGAAGLQGLVYGATAALFGALFGGRRGATVMFLIGFAIGAIRVVIEFVDKVT